MKNVSVSPTATVAEVITDAGYGMGSKVSSGGKTLNLDQTLQQAGVGNNGFLVIVGEVKTSGATEKDPREEIERLRSELESLKNTDSKYIEIPKPQIVYPEGTTIFAPKGEQLLSFLSTLTDGRRVTGVKDEDGNDVNILGSVENIKYVITVE